MNSILNLMFFHEPLFGCFQYDLHPSVECAAVPVQCLLKLSANTCVNDVQVDFRLGLVDHVPFGVAQPILKRLPILLVALEPVAGAQDILCAVDGIGIVSQFNEKWVQTFLDEPESHFSLRLIADRLFGLFCWFKNRFC